jgi:hypothetical protein
MFCAVSTLGTLFVLTLPGTASAQWFGRRCNPCCCPCPVPVAQAAYQVVPVTEVHEVRQVVQKPIYETEYVNRDVTVYEPVQEARTAEVPTVNYRNVTEYRTVQRDMGYWATQRRCNPRVSPCRYDPRPNFSGWLNRTGYQIRSSFTPRVTTHRQYIPNVVAQQVPFTRRVAEHGTRKVTYNVTRIVPRTETRKVAVNKVRYVSHEIVRKVPRTVYRNVPIGSTFAYGGSAGNSRSADLSPSPDGIGGGSGSRSADRRNDSFERDNFDDEEDKFDDDQGFRRGSSLDVPLDEPRQTRALPRPSTRDDNASPGDVTLVPRRVPTAVRVTRWKNRHPVAFSPNGPAMSLANTVR